MPAGELDRRIVIQTVTEGEQSSYGEPERVVATLATVWASVRRPGGGQSYQSKQVDTVTELTFRIRYRTDISITTKHEIVYDGHTYDVVELNEIGRRQYLDLVGVAKTPA